MVIVSPLAGAALVGGAFLFAHDLCNGYGVHCANGVCFNRPTESAPYFDVCKALYNRPPWILLSGLAGAVGILWNWWRRSMQRNKELKREREVADANLNLARSQLDVDRAELDAKRHERFLNTTKEALQLIESGQRQSRLSGVRMLIRLVRVSVDNKDWADVAATLETLNDIRMRLEMVGPDKLPSEETDGSDDGNSPDAHAAALSEVATNSAAANDDTQEVIRVIHAATPTFRLEQAELAGVSLEGISLHGAKLEGADLTGTNLQGANLQSAKLRGAELIGTNLQGADLRRARLERAKLQGGKLRGAKLQSANLQGAGPLSRRTPGR